MRIPIGILLLVLLSFSFLHAQERTVREMAAAAQGDVSISISADGMAPVFAEVVKTADVIVRATVGNPVTHISEDGERIYSDYPLTISAVLFQKGVFTASKPGASPLVLRQLGGTVQVDGRKVSMSHSALPPLKPGTDAILLLTRQPDGYFTIAKQHFGAFAVKGGRVFPLAKYPGEHERWRNTSVSHFVRAVREARGKV